MRTIPRLKVLTVLCLAAPLFSQTTPEIATRETPLTFKSNVRLVSVPVVVRDKQGRAIGNLTRDDFQLLENGKPQILSRFSVERLAATPEAGSGRTEIPDRFIAYVFDDLHMRPEHLLWVRDALLQRLAGPDNPLERTAIYSTSGQILMDFTADRERLSQTLRAIVPRGSRSDLSMDCPPMTEFMADLIINKNDRQALSVGIADYFACAGPMPGDADKMVQATAHRALALADADAGRALDALASIVGKLAAMPGQRSLLVASPGFLLLDSNRRQQQSELIDRSIKLNVITHAFDARGLDVRIPGGGASDRIAGTGDSARIKTDYQRRSDLQLSGVLADLASSTGGRFFENTNDAGGVLARVATPEYLYVLGFVPQALKADGKFRSLKVALRNSKAFTVDARRGYYSPRYDEDPAEHDKREIEDALFSRDETRDLPADLQIQFTKGPNGEATVAVLTKFNLSEIPFRKVEDRNRDDITIVAGLFDENGNYVSGVQKILEMRLRDETIARRKGTGYTVRTDFSVKPGTYLVRLVARDSEGKLLTARSGTVEVP